MTQPVAAVGAWLGRAAREPMLHSLVAGALLFAVNARYAGDAARAGDARTIRVTDDSLLQYIKYNEKAFAGQADARVRAMLDAMSAGQRKALVDAYVKEEALYREARALGLDETDYVIRRRLVQAMEYLYESAVDSTPADASDPAVVRYFDANKARYAAPATVTFTHVFFDGAAGREAARARATATLRKLRSGRVPFEGAPRHGDRFPYYVNYVEEPREVVVSHFGEAVAQQVFGATAPGDWQGPFESPHGFHLLLVAARSAGRTPALEEVMPLVAVDFRRDQASRRQEALIRAAIESYRVEVGKP